MEPVAYFSMEIALAPAMPTYAGGLGVLAGDTLRAAADIGIPMVGVTLLHRAGYFRQHLDAAGRQREEPMPWRVEDFLTEEPARAALTIEGRRVTLRCWKHMVRGTAGAVPVYLLDADVPGNDPADRRLTDSLYGGDLRYRLCQEAILGIGGVRMLRALGHERIERYHMNEGHSSLLVMELLESQDVAAVRDQCVFTTHTPVEAGHDQFPMALARQVLGESPLFGLQERCCAKGLLNLTLIGLNFSRYVNGVAMRHGEVSRRMYAGYAIDAITNGVHAASWAAPELAALFDRHIAGWRRDNLSLRYALGIAPAEIREAHQGVKRRLLALVESRSGARLDPQAFTIGFARRATSYKRADLLVQDVERLKAIAARAGALQVIYAGKAHPRDAGGKAMIEAVYRAKDAAAGRVPIVYLEDYDVELAQAMVAGTDLWLNTPLAPQEASGTSGMKAAINGVPSLSVLDGWWIEGHLEGVTGWSIDPPQEAASLYDKLERVILPLYYAGGDGYAGVMRQAIALNGSFFNTHRAMGEYLLKAYRA
ncbi:MAG TPA: alpha-glucan family phosphorylase [Burkholderiales bacterium]|nr:alpha-glucan family phosphorylase [Burkholderiales bacterium]